MAYVLGFFAADGYMIRNKRGGCFIDFYSVDKEIIQKIRTLIGSNHKITRRIGYPPRQDSYRMQIGSKSWFTDLSNMGFIQNKSRVIKFPNMPHEYLPDFVRGYFDGDGSVNLGRYWRKDRQQWHWEYTTRFTSGSRSFLEVLLTRLRPHMRGGFIYEKQKEGTHSAYELVFSRKDTVALFALMYHNTSPERYLERKYRVFQKIFRVSSMRA